MEKLLSIVKNKKILSISAIIVLVVIIIVLGMNLKNHKDNTNAFNTEDASMTTEMESTETDVTAIDKTMYVIVDNLEARKTSTAFADSLGKIEKGTKVSVTGECKNGWYQIDYKGKNGYVPRTSLADAMPTEATESSEASTQPTSEAVAEAATPKEDAGTTSAENDLSTYNFAVEDNKTNSTPSNNTASQPSAPTQSTQPSSGNAQNPSVPSGVEYDENGFPTTCERGTTPDGETMYRVPGVNNVYVVHADGSVEVYPEGSYERYWEEINILYADGYIDCPVCGKRASVLPSNSGLGTVPCDCGYTE